MSIVIFYSSLKGNFGKRLPKPSPKVNFVRAKKRHLKNQQADKAGLEATNSPKKVDGSPTSHEVTIFEMQS